MISFEAIGGILREKSDIEVHRTLNSGNRLFEVNKWNISAFLIKKVIGLVGIHPYPMDELMLMVSACIVFRPELIIEWGTNVGKSARVFYETVRHYRIKSEIVSIDLPIHVTHPENVKRRRAKYIKRKKVSLLLGDGAEIAAKVVKERSQSLNGYILYFLDGEHSYETVKREIGTLYMIYPKTIFLVHDTFFQREWSNYNIGPFKAVENFIKNHSDWKTVACTTGLPGMTLVYKNG
ncbi:MAG: class I SAM-dependent methyltransferase [Nitrospirota bacterium]